MEDNEEIKDLCVRLSEMKDVFLPAKQSENEENQKEKEHLTSNEKSIQLEQYFKQSPVKFLQRYHEYIKPREISCFNALPDTEEVEYYIKKICHKQDMISRSELDSHYISHEVKNRRYRAMQKLIKEGEYFSDEEMMKRCPDLYEYYIGRFLTKEEKEEKLRARAAAHPVSLSGFFMEVIENRNERDEMEEIKAEEEEFDEDSDEEQEQTEEGVPVISKAEKEYMAEEFKSRMYQHFLDGLDKNFAYESVDESAEYDDLAQISQDVEDEYFDEEEPSDVKTAESKKTEEDSEDELDKYMRTLEEK